jgi:hypothetical protein
MAGPPATLNKGANGHIWEGATPLAAVRRRSSGDQAALATALQARGWQVQSGTGVLRIHRAAAPPPSPAASGQKAG